MYKRQVWWCYPIAEVFSLIVSLLCFRRLHRTLISKLPEDGPAPCPEGPAA